jgi:transketolase
VIAPCDPLETELATRWCAQENESGPVYLRLGKAGEPVVTDKAVDPFVPGRLRYIRKGRDVCILVYGPTVKHALALADRIEAERGQSVSVVSCHTVKPLDLEGVAKALKDHAHVVVMEEHVPHGGLGSRVKEIAWDERADCVFDHFSLKDKFIHAYGNHDQVLAAHDFTPERFFERLSAA